MASPQNNVQIQLSAQGVAEVVNALRQVQREGAATSARFAGLSKGIGAVAAVTAGAVYGFVELAKKAIELGDALGDLASATGLSAKTLSTLNYAAEQAGVSYETMEKGVKKLLINLSDLSAGSKSAKDAFAAIGLSAKDFAGLNTDQKVEKVVMALGRYKGSADKLAIAQQLLGKGAVDMLDIFGNLADQGFGTVGEAAAKAGRMFDDDFTRAAGEAKAQMADLKNKAQMAATYFTTGFIPQIVKAFEPIDKGAADSAKSFTSLGDTAGKMARFIIGAFRIAGTFIAAVGAKAMVAWDGYLEKLKSQLEESTETVKGVSYWIQETFGSSKKKKKKHAVRDPKTGEVNFVEEDSASAGRPPAPIDGVAGSINKKPGNRLMRRRAIAEPDRPGQFRWVEMEESDNAQNVQPQTRSSRAFNRAAEIARQREELQKKFDEEQAAITESAVADIGKQWEIATTALPPPDKNQSGAGSSGGNGAGQNVNRGAADDVRAAQEKLQKATEDYQKAVAEARIKLAEARQKLADEQDKNTFNAGLESLKTYFAHRRAALQQAADEELTALGRQQQQIAARKTSAPAEAKKKAADLEKVKGEIAARRVDLERELLALNTEEASQQKSLDAQKLEAVNRLAEARGDYAAAASAALEDEITKTRVLLAQQGASADEIERLVEAQKRLGKASIALDQATRASSALMADIEAKRAELDNRVNLGLLSKIRAEYELQKLQRQKIADLEKQAKLAEQAAAQTGNPDDQARARDLRLQVEYIKTATDQTAQALAKLTATFEDSLASGLEEFFVALADGSKNLSEAFEDMARSVVQSMVRMVAQLMAQRAMLAMMKLFDGASGGSTAAAGAAAATLEAATGGYITGPGSGTSDSIPARLSNGEFVVRAAVVAQPGMLELLSQMNAGMQSPVLRRQAVPRGIPKFAEGGLVSAPASGGVIRIINVTDPAAAGDYLNSSAGEQVVLNVLQKNAGALRQILGG